MNIFANNIKDIDRYLAQSNIHFLMQIDRLNVSIRKCLCLAFRHVKNRALVDKQVAYFGTN